MKGKEAASAWRKRADEARAECDGLIAKLKAERADHGRQVHELEAQVRSERSNHMAEAGRLASEEVERRLAEAESERRNRGLSDDIVTHMLYRNDRFILNACRYISMTTGEDPITALGMVLTWRTDKDVTKLPTVDQLIEMCVPMDGWVTRQVTKLSPGWRKSKVYDNLAISLDHAEEKGHERIHRNYRSDWYPKHVEYGGIELVRDEQTAS